MRRRRGDSELGGEARASGEASSVLASVRRAKAWGGLAGFTVAGAGSALAGNVLFDIGVRALAGGLVAYGLAWVASLAVARVVLEAESRAALERVRGQHGEATETR